MFSVYEKGLKINPSGLEIPAPGLLA